MFYPLVISLTRCSTFSVLRMGVLIVVVYCVVFKSRNCFYKWRELGQGERLSSLSDFSIMFGEILGAEAVHISDFSTWGIQQELWLLFNNWNSRVYFKWKVCFLLSAGPPVFVQVRAFFQGGLIRWKKRLQLFDHVAASSGDREENVHSPHPSLLCNAKLKELSINASKTINCEGLFVSCCHHHHLRVQINLFVDSAVVSEFQVLSNQSEQLLPIAN